ncbi:nucleotide sugar dehydrogenase [Streptomyces collinus]|uniref:nucleotide sugar dehydrogenase n=1 Tax=Streptomyces collinus TaxID=42684 RepID=UPI00369F26CE
MATDGDLANVGLPRKVTDVAVIGLGYVGLQLAREACRAGLIVRGLDRDTARVGRLQAGFSTTDDVSDNDVNYMLSCGFEASDNVEILSNARAIVICVPTPLSENGTPDLRAVKRAAEAAAGAVTRECLVILESTTYPGTTEEVVRPILERAGLIAGKDFCLAFSPERIDPGNSAYELRNTPKIVGGLTPACTDAAALFYGKLVNTVIRAKGLMEAEMAKLLENTYRQVNIALVNEMAMACHELGIDIWDAIEGAATKPFGFQPFRPGPGVGGHCIPIDPHYLAYRVRRQLGRPLHFVELAGEINGRMPRYVVERAQQMLNRTGKPLNGSHVCLLGVTYKADIADQRETPAVSVVRQLRELGAELSYHDPYVMSWEVDGSAMTSVEDPLDAVSVADLSILLTPHRAYQHAELAGRANLLLDTRGIFSRAENVELL